jgi:hypothetical protein
MGPSSVVGHALDERPPESEPQPPRADGRSIPGRSELALRATTALGALDLVGTFAFALTGALTALRATGSTSSAWSRSG